MVIQNAITCANKRGRSSSWRFSSPSASLPLPPSSCLSPPPQLLILCLSGMGLPITEPVGHWKQLSISHHSTLMRTLVSLAGLSSKELSVCLPGFLLEPWLPAQGLAPRGTWLIFVKWVNTCSCSRCAPREPILQYLSLPSLMRHGLKVFIGKNAKCPTPSWIVVKCGKPASSVLMLSTISHTLEGIGSVLSRSCLLQLILYFSISPVWKLGLSIWVTGHSQIKVTVCFHSPHAVFRIKSRNERRGKVPRCVPKEGDKQECHQSTVSLSRWETQKASTYFIWFAQFHLKGK